MVYMIKNKTLEIDMKLTKFMTKWMEKEMKLNEINYALKDIMATMMILRDDKELDDPYILKLYREFDKLVEMKQKIMEKL
jgi:hypothetical protein